jgi:hypothetical protein
MAVANTIAYYNAATITTLKSFIALAKVERERERELNPQQNKIVIFVLLLSERYFIKKLKRKT